MAEYTTLARFSAGDNISRAFPNLWQWSRGQVLQIEGLTLPASYTVHFSNSPFGYDPNAEGQIGDAEGVDVPDSMLQSGQPVYAWIWLSETTSAETAAQVIIEVNRRAQPPNYEPTPEEETIIDEAIAALNNASSSIGSLKLGLIQNSGNIFADVGTFSPRPTPALTVTWSDNNTKAHIVGTPAYETMISLYSFESPQTPAPPLEFDTEFTLMFGSDSPSISLWIKIDENEQTLTDDTKITIPTGTEYFEIALVIGAGTVDNNVLIGIPFSTSRLELEDEIDDLRMDPITNAQIDELFT